MPIPTQSVQTDGFTMEFFRFGRGRETLAILPGLGLRSVMDSADAVAAAYRPLTDDFTVYVFDRRKDLPDTYPVRAMARDTAQALRALGLDQTSIFGASQGGMIAMQIAIDRPELVRKLVLGSTAACVTPERYQTVGDWVRLAKEERTDDLFTAFAQALYPPEVYERSRAYFAAAAESVTKDDLKRFICLAEGMRDFDVTQELHRIACPVLVIGSSDDRVIGEDAALQIMRCLGRRPDCELYMYDGCGHAAYDTAADYPERLLRFLNR
ncbi:MAG: alpha/beta hydrolase [Clostridia bacterium]|nr:alpha/beta hydrolase [Clostridia bacterium]